MKPLGARAPVISAARVMQRAMTPSDSEGSLAEGYMSVPPMSTIDSTWKTVDDEMGETEAVLVTVR